MDQKVELLEEKLRMYFAYWLEICDMKIKREVVNECIVILIFEGIDSFIDLYTRKESVVSFWLPKCFPDRFKVIVTANSSSSAMSYFRKLGSTIIDIPADPMIIRNLLDNYQEKPSFTDQQRRDKIYQILGAKTEDALSNSLFVKTFMATLTPYPTEGIISLSEVNPQEIDGMLESIDYEELKDINNTEQLFDFILEFYSQKMLQAEKFRKILCAITLTQKGLTLAELTHLVRINDREWKKLIAVFKVFLMTYKGYWKINSEPFKKAVYEKFMKDDDYVLKLHIEIAEILSKFTPNSVRKLEEETFHLFMARDFFRLKEVMSVSYTHLTLPTIYSV
eukprot:TRINITY_DN9001_c0_g2_i1.p1 TRINITY_DN9001_c0_g2~~TRINITY_DN9001_c0_g2_i1.p1  ORF type:complete len:336 (-),score=56.78 TRINITY_DN9001_c0_g2_i1:34-1041(-)